MRSLAQVLSDENRALRPSGWAEKYRIYWKPINIVMLVAAAPGVMVGRVLAYWTLKVLLMLCDWVGVLKP